MMPFTINKVEYKQEKNALMSEVYALDKGRRPDAGNDEDEYG
jgi:hypothetical protein